MLKQVLQSTGCFITDILDQFSPCFPVDASDILVLSEPEQFYSTLLQKSSTASFRITLASLYLGTERLEVNLIDRINRNLNKNPKLFVRFLLDFNRGSRYSSRNSRTTLLSILDDNCLSRCQISLYRTPKFGWLKSKLIPDRVNEIFGLQHMKLYIFDNETLISGANLSQDYFTNRQDRYFLIHDKNLADFFDDLIRCVEQFSYRLHANNTVEAASKNKIELLQIVSSFWARNSRKYHSNISEKHDTYVYPLIEMSQIGFKNDSLAMQAFFQNPVVQNSNLVLATGYFNLTDRLQNLILQNNAAPNKWKILTAHPMANGFFESKGFSKIIPDLYSYLVHRLQSILETFPLAERKCEILEYFRNNWTFHAKGLWCFPASNDYACTIVGSSNFGYRSQDRDLEAQVLIVTRNNKLKAALKNECEQIMAYAQPFSSNRNYSLAVKIIANLFRNYF